MMSSLAVQMSQARILVVEDEETTLSALTRALGLIGYRTDGAASGEEALAKLDAGAFDLMLLDLHMPGMDGVEVMQRARQRDPNLLVIVLTGKASLESAIAAVRVGAVDYLLKPCRIQQISDAVGQALDKRRARLRRQQLIQVIDDALRSLKAEEERESRSAVFDADRFVRCGCVTLDQEKWLTVVTHPGESATVNVELTANEAALLAFMMQHPDVVFSCQELARAVLNQETNRSEAQSLIRPHISRLRKKIELDPARPRLIRTIRSKGYLFSSL